MNFLVSFPRSGQGLTKRLLQDVYRHHGWEFSYCLYYLCCKKTPCEKGSLFQKQHDFQLALNINKNDRYVVLYRQDMITQLEAFFRWFKRGQNITFDYTNASVRSELVAFIRWKRDYYQQFLDKWVYAEDAVAIEYNDYIQDPADAIVKMLKVFRPHDDVSRQNIQSIMDSREEQVEFKNRLSEETRQSIEQAVEADGKGRRLARSPGNSLWKRWLSTNTRKAA